jgi:glycosyltransferase involved in cell wall biosynthesis
MTALRVSVVMPSYNHARYLPAAVDSVLAQGYGALDLLVLDGGSQDETVDILESYGERLQFVSGPDRGQGDAINRGFAWATGDILCWLNSDDMFVPGVIPRVVQAFEEHPDVDFVYGRGWNLSDSGEVEDAGVLTLDLWKLIHQRNFIQQPSCFFRRSLLERVGPIDESLHYVMDWDLWIRFGAYRGLYVDEFWSYNRVHRQNKTQSGHFRRWAEIRRMVRRYTDTRWPPVMSLYLLEAILHRFRDRRVPRAIEGELVRIFSRGMQREMSGRYPDGGVDRRFRFSVGDPGGDGRVALTLSPLSRYDRSRLGQDPVTIRWRASTGSAGVLSLRETGLPQQFALLLPRSAPFVHVTCRADHPGVPLGAGGGLPPRRIVGFLDAVSV